MSDIPALATALGDALRARGWTVATAESCTGGLVAGAITEVAGSSEWFDRGFVTYSNDAKVALLGVPPALIDQYGAVSEQVARAMAEGALAHSRADAAVAITGIAGPGGATPGKPVGMVCIALADDPRVAKHLVTIALHPRRPRDEPTHAHASRIAATRKFVRVVTRHAMLFARLACKRLHVARTSKGNWQCAFLSGPS